MFPFLEAGARFGATCDAAGVAGFLGGSAATTLHFEVDAEALGRAARHRSS